MSGSSMKIVRINNLSAKGYFQSRAIKGLRKAFSSESIDGIRVLEAIPRWMILKMPGVNVKKYDYIKKAEKIFIRDTLGIKQNIKKLSDEDKFLFLKQIVGPEIAGSGISFIKKYREFETEELKPILDMFNKQNLNIKNLTITTIIQGIVQKSGTQDLIQRLAKMINPETRIIDIRTFGSQKQLTVTMKTDLFSFHIFKGVLSSNISTTPRIFHVADLAQALAPYNLIIYSDSAKPVVLPEAMHIYTINIDKIRETKYQIYQRGLIVTGHLAGAARLITDTVKEFMDNISGE